VNRYYGFLYSEGVFSTIDYPGSTYTSAFDISNSGEIVGIYYDSSGLSHGYYYKAGVFSSLDFPGALQTFATGMNDLGQIVGYYDDGSGRPHGFLYSGGVFKNIDYHAPASSNWYKDTVPYDINNSGQIVGQVDIFKINPVH
jgi:probable HAF family extracellular repeat protein